MCLSGLKVCFGFAGLSTTNKKGVQVFAWPTNQQWELLSVGEWYGIAILFQFAKHSPLVLLVILVSLNDFTVHEEEWCDRLISNIALVFVYDYHPCSKTLYQSHFTHEGQAALFAEQQAQSRAAQTIGPSTTLVPEITLWSYITQITSAIKNIHGCGLAARNIEPSKILVTGKNRQVSWSLLLTRSGRLTVKPHVIYRLRLNYSATQDVIQYDGGQNIARHQASGAKQCR